MSAKQAKKDEEKKELSKDKRIKKEINRLKKLYKDLPKNKQEVAIKLINNAAFMAVTLDILMVEINNNGVKEEYQNGANQNGFKDSVEIKTYQQMIKNYMSIIKQLTDLLPQGSAANLPEDEFDRFNGLE